MPILISNCELVQLSKDELICNFDCGNEDLNDFFYNDALNYHNQLLGRTLFFRKRVTLEIVCAFTLSNDSIKMNELPGSAKKRVKKGIPDVKSMNSYPATLIGRFGVPNSFAGSGIGSQVMDFIKSICLTEDANKCRFLLVDSYNTLSALKFYEKNEFKFLFSEEGQEKEHYKKEELRTRFMFFDLLTWKQKLS